jgi:enoyl-CoA hydratase/carnithine racemase
MSNDPILIEREGFVATVVLNRPERKNSLNPEMLLLIAKHLGELSKDDEVRTVVFRGAGEGSFSSGYDISELPTGLTEEQKKELKDKSPIEIGLDAVENYKYPTVAMIDGYAFGAGCELAVTCDIRIASVGSRMGIPPSRLGLVYHPKGIQRFINVVGLANAKELFFTGRFYEVERALEMGMVSYLVKREELHAFTYGMAREIAANAPLALKGHKHIFNRLLSHQGISEEDYPEIEKMITDSLNSEDLKEGATAFFEKRPAKFKGR